MEQIRSSAHGLVGLAVSGRFVGLSDRDAAFCRHMAYLLLHAESVGHDGRPLLVARRLVNYVRLTYA